MRGSVQEGVKLIRQLQQKKAGVQSNSLLQGLPALTACVAVPDLEARVAFCAMVVGQL